VELSDRCIISNEWPAHFYVSIHINSDGPDAQGIECLYTSDAGKELAIPIQEFLVAATKEHDRGVKKNDSLWVLNGTNCPSVLVECLFISNPANEALLATKDYQVLLAHAIVCGIQKYLSGVE
jgi:N-acetylmuramoyl-L-alanine amidase